MKSKNMNLEKLTIEEMETLKAILKKLREDDKKYEWKATSHFLRGDGYYYVSQDGNVCRSTWQFGKADWSKFHLNNTFKSEKQAELELEKRKIIAILQQYSKECWEQSGKSEQETWKDNASSKFYISYQTKQDQVIVSSVIQHKYVNNIYFPKSENAHKAIEMIGEENLKTYVFGVGVKSND